MEQSEKSAKRRIFLYSKFQILYSAPYPSFSIKSINFKISFV